MLRMMSIASGSSGNCIYIGSDNTHILIDTGISRKRICEGLKKLELSIEDIDGVFLTHEHIDHVKGAGVIMRNDSLPFFGTAGTLRQMWYNKSLGEMSKDLLNVIEKDKEICLGDLSIKAFHISHDASDPVAYTVSCGDKKVGTVTDLGFFDESIVENMSGCDAFLAEANHDINMLQVGPYPYALKQRILGNRGHLSNELSGKLVSELLHDNVKAIILGHLSKENNYDRLAFETVKQEIDMADNDYTSGDFNISVAGRDEASEIIEV